MRYLKAETKEGLWLVLGELVTMLGVYLGNKFIKK